MTAKIYHADLYGSRKHKYEMLLNADLQSIDWQELSPNAPFYLFRPQEQELREEYEQGWSVADIFPVHGVGITTARDDYVIDFDADKLLMRAKAFQEAIGTDKEVCERLKIALKEGWNVTKARQELQAEANLSSFLETILYRPYDLRHIFYHDALVWRTVKKIMQHMTKGNIGLVTTRITKDDWDCSVCKTLMGHKALAAYDINSLFPLWVYPNEGGLGFEEERRPNLNPAFVAEMAGRVGFTPAPEAIFHYAYAVFHAPTYRERYAPFLKIDFPRLPLPADADTFQELAALGERLVSLHLLEAPELARHGIAYPVGGDHRVQKMRAAERYLPPLPDGTPGRVRLNATEYFDNVPPQAWEFRVGGYQPASKWLDDRAERFLTEAEITHYRRMLAAMRETAAILPDVDAAFCRMLG